eukprot:5760318-Ditylum_brightwellii.AAC.1
MMNNMVLEEGRDYDQGGQEIPYPENSKSMSTPWYMWVKTSKHMKINIHVSTTKTVAENTSHTMT